MLADNIRDLILEGESETVELKRSVPPARSLARTLAAFANARGGILLLGVEEQPSKRAVGVDADKAEMSIQRAAHSLDPPPVLRISRVTVDGVDLVAAEISATTRLTLAPDGLFKRVGELDRPFTPAEVVERISSSADQEEIQDPGALAQAVARLTQQLDDQAPLLESLIKANHWRRKGFWILVGAVAGAVAKVLVS